jgi:hypothetical protein
MSRKYLILFRFYDAIDRTDFDALRIVKIAFAFHTGLRVDDIDFIAFGDGIGRAFRFACATRDAFLVDC